MIDREELTAWLRLTQTPGIGRAAARRLLAAFASPEAACSASLAALARVVDAEAAQALRTPSPALAASVQATLRWIQAADGTERGLLLLGDADYPPLLLETADPPLLLFLEGQRRLLTADALAVVGSRNPTPQGVENARGFAAELSRAGYSIVSGLALGIDAAAHRGGLEGSGSTIAVVGTGLDRVYPERNRPLAAEIATRGLLLSEFALGTPPLAAHFPQRNRLIAGLSLGTLVIEAALKSGSLITARLAADAAREVFAIPGSIHSPQSRGCHRLIKDGAQLVENTADILAALRPGTGRLHLTGVDTPGSRADASSPDFLLQALGHEPSSLEALIARTGCSAAELSARLLDLELSGQVARLPGQLFQRMARA